VALAAARQAIEHGDRRAALDLLAAVARGELPGDDLEPVVSEALVATARAEQQRDRAALARYEQARTAGEQEREPEQPESMRIASDSRRRLGAGSLEAKLIRGHGPYLYFRYREGGRHRSVYIGKAEPRP